MHRAVFALIGLLAVSSPALADNPYAVAGISNPAHVREFFIRLKQVVAAGDSAAVATMVDYPLTIGSRTYRNAVSLRHDYARVYTPDVVAAVAAAKPDNLFTRDQGVMIGQGEIWVNEIRGSMKIITVNHMQQR